MIDTPALADGAVMVNAYARYVQWGITVAWQPLIRTMVNGVFCHPTAQWFAENGRSMHANAMQCMVGLLTMTFLWARRWHPFPCWYPAHT